MSSIGAYYGPKPFTPVPPVRPMDREVVRTGTGQAPSPGNTALLGVLALVAMYFVFKKLEKA